MTDPLSDTLEAIELAALLFAVGLFFAAMFWPRKRYPPPACPVSPVAHRGAELATLAEDNKRPRVIDAADLFAARKAKEPAK